MTTLFFKKIHLLSFFILLYVSTTAVYSNEKQLYFFGGGGEPDGDSTIFDDDIDAISQYVNSADSAWKVHYTFNGGHEKTEKKLNAKLKNAKSFGRFNQSHFEETIKDIEKKIESSELKSGDQLILMMDTHGSRNSPKEKSHLVSASPNEDEFKKSPLTTTKVSMDKFETITLLAQKKGLKLALIDLSCFSGNTLKISNKDVCVISGSGENQYGYSEPSDSPKNAFTTFEGRFLNGMKKGENLENLFLKSRLGSRWQDFPMISTDVGKQVNDLIYKILSPYFIYNDKKIFEFSQSYDSKNEPEALCKTEGEYSEVKKRIKEISELYSIPKNMMNFTKLEMALDAYRAYQVEFENVFGESLKAVNEIKGIILRDYPNQAKLFDNEEGVSILYLTSQREKSMKYFQELMKKDKNNWFNSSYQQAYNTLALKNEIIKKIFPKVSTDAKEKLKKFDQFYHYSAKTEKLADNVATEAKYFYDKIYRAQVLKGLENNPCKDFVL
jgi:hypothetical protein